MDFTYFLFLLTFLGYPIVGYLISEKVINKISKNLKKGILYFFIFHNLLFYIGLSIKGDYFDYSIFSLEYLVFSTYIFSLNTNKKIQFKIIYAIGIFTQIIMSFIGFIGFWIFIVISQDFESKKTIYFNNSEYYSRFYSSGFVTSSSTNYQFDTYKNFKILPLEFKIDDFLIRSSESNFSFEVKELTIDFIKKENFEKLIFTNSRNENFERTIK